MSGRRILFYRFFTGLFLTDVTAMSPLAPSFRPAFVLACLIIFFCFIFPAWNASAKMDFHKRQASTIMFEPVSKFISNTRKLLLCRLEPDRMKELMSQSVTAESAFTASDAVFVLRETGNSEFRNFEY